MATPPLAQAIARQRFVFPKSAHVLEAITLEPSASLPGATDVTLQIAGEEHRLTAAPGKWRHGQFTVGGEKVAAAASGAWTAADTFTLDVARTPHAVRDALQLTFADEQVTLASEPNVGPPPPAPVTGRRAGAARGAIGARFTSGGRALQHGFHFVGIIERKDGSRRARP